MNLYWNEKKAATGLPAITLSQSVLSGITIATNTTLTAKQHGHRVFSAHIRVNKIASNEHGSLAIKNITTPLQYQVFRTLDRAPREIRSLPGDIACSSMPMDRFHAILRVKRGVV